MGEPGTLANGNARLKREQDEASDRPDGTSSAP